MNTGRKILGAIGALKNRANKLLWSFLAVSLVVHWWAMAVASRYMHREPPKVIELELSAAPEKKVTVSPPPRGLSHQDSVHKLPVPDVTPAVARIPERPAPPKSLRVQETPSHPMPVPDVTPVVARVLQPPMPPKPVPVPQESQSVQVPQVLSQARPEVNPVVARNAPDEASARRELEPSATSLATTGNPQGIVTETSQGDSKDVLDRFLAGVRLRIDRSKRYPFVARRQHMEGRVGLRFSIRPDGSAHGVQVVQSSGSRLLDRAAMEAVQRAAPFPGFPRQFMKRALSVEIAIVFHLE